MAVRPAQVFQLLLQAIVQILVWVVLWRGTRRKKQLDFVLMIRYPFTNLHGPVHTQVVNDQKLLAGRAFVQALEEGDEQARGQRPLEPSFPLPFTSASVLAPGGRWVTATSRPVSLAKSCNSRIHSLTRAPLLPPQSAVMVSVVAFG